MWMSNYDDLRIVGYRGGAAVIEQQIEAGGIPRTLILTADDTELDADGGDMTRVIIKIVDKYGNRLPYAIRVVTFECDGPGEFIGENPLALPGGQAAVFLKAGKTSGVVTLRAFSNELAPAAVTINIR